MNRKDDLLLEDYLEHIQRAIERIRRYLSGVDRSMFLAHEEKQDAVIRNLEIIGEAAGKIMQHFPEFSRQHPDLPLKAAYGTRNALSHGYFKVDLDVVWNTAKKDIPSMEILVSEALYSLSQGGPSPSL